MTERSLLLGVDAGTTVVKTVAFETDGTEVAVAKRLLPVVSPAPGWSEVDMLAAWRATAETISDVASQIDAELVAAIGISGTCAGVWPIDDNGLPTRNAILWNDGRAAGVIEEWKLEGIFRRMFEVSGCTAVPGYTLPSLRWLADNDPESLERAKWLLFHKDWLRYQLSADIHVDPTDVSYTPGDIRERGYSLELFELCGLNDYLDRLPPLASSQEVVGHLTPNAAAELDLPVETPVVTGADDVITGTIGAGAIHPGQAVSILSTSFTNSLVIGKPSFVPIESGAEASMPNGYWLRSLINTSGTMNIDWMIDNLGMPEEQQAEEAGVDVFDLIEDVVSGAPIGARGIIYLPYLNTAGINSPFSAPNARAMFFGISVEHSREDLMRAVYEGTALAMRDCYEAFGEPAEEVFLVGGGSRSSFWSQLLADAIERKITITEGTEIGARGVAMLAGIGVGIFDSLEEAVSRMVRVKETYEPHEENSRAFRAIYQLYRHLYMQARESWNLRADLVEQIGERQAENTDDR